MTTPAPRQVDFVAAVTAAVDAELAARPGAPLAAAARSLALAPAAKRARPALAFELARLAGADWRPLLDAAVMIELIHTASLVHDDIVDAAPTRRGLPSVNASAGNATAVLVGDDLLVRAFLRVAERPPLVRAGLIALGSMVHAVAAEIAARGDVALTEAGWRALADGKTAVLFALCGRFAGLAADDLALAEQLAAAGHHLGLAFQAADDAADLAVGDDLVERAPNLAVVHAATHAPAVALRLASAWARGPLTAAEHARLRAEVIGAGGLARCAEVAAAELAAADALLAPLAVDDDRRAALATIRTWAATLAARHPTPHGAAA
ncbi:MAG: polyprenyl synthetase family protein [Kofleriaceae bacterium]